MTSQQNVVKDPSFFSITWPIFIEISLHMSVGILATLILSHYSDDAVAGVGVSNQILNLFILVFNVTAIGSTILIGQNIGAKNFNRATQLSRSAFGVNFWLGFIVTALVFSSANFLLQFYALEGIVHHYALTFLRITSISLLFEALSMVLGSILRSYGYTKEAMIVTLFMNIISVAGNYIAITGPFDLPVTGVTGVAWAIVAARLFALVTLLILTFKIIGIRIRIKHVIKIPKRDILEVLSIGLPSAGEYFSHQISQLVITGFVSLLGSAYLSARVYIVNISMICFLFSSAIAQGNQLLVARNIGSRQFERAYNRTIRTLKLATFISFIISLAIALIGRPLIELFTIDETIISIALPVLWAIVFIEPGRAMNLVLMSSLKSAGDVRFPVMIGVISMWGIAVVLSYILGIRLELGLLGVWLAQGFDEWFRAIFATRRWMVQKWRKKYTAELASDHQYIN